MVDIRLAERGDAGAIAAIYEPIVRETIISFERTPPDEDEMANRIEATVPTYPWLVCVHDGTLLGYAYASSHRTRESYQWSVDVSVYVHPEHRRAGIGYGLYESLFALLREQGYYNAYAGIALPNRASVGLHESLGFEEVGTYRNVGYKNGAWQDVGWWHLQLLSVEKANHNGEPERKIEPESTGIPEAPRSLTALDETTKDDAIDRGRRSVRIP